MFIVVAIRLMIRCFKFKIYLIPSIYLKKVLKPAFLNLFSSSLAYQYHVSYVVFKSYCVVEPNINNAFSICSATTNAHGRKRNNYKINIKRVSEKLKINSSRKQVMVNLERMRFIINGVFVQLF